jgi:hypothetical protein
MPEVIKRRYAKTDMKVNRGEVQMRWCGKIGFLPFGRRSNVPEDVAPIYVQT